jgi:hypothetical protein
VIISEYYPRILLQRLMITVVFLYPYYANIYTFMEKQTDNLGNIFLLHLSRSTCWEIFFLYVCDERKKPLAIPHFLDVA